MNTQSAINSGRATIRRLHTDVPGLDEVLGGGAGLMAVWLIDARGLSRG